MAHAAAVLTAQSNGWENVKRWHAQHYLKSLRSAARVRNVMWEHSGDDSAWDALYDARDALLRRAAGAEQDGSLQWCAAYLFEVGAPE